MNPLVEELAEVFKVFGDVNRLKIIKLLSSNMKDKLCVQDLSKVLNITQPAASQHLKVLKSIKLLSAKKEGYRVYYYINIDVFKTYKKKMDMLFELAFKRCEDTKNCEGCVENCE